MEGTMFEHPQFTQFQITKVPLDSDLIIMDEKWIADYEREWSRVFDSREGDPYSVGYVTRVAARSVGDGWVELSWYVNINDRFHELPLFLPEDRIVACVDVQAYDEKPHIFVRSDWLVDIHEKPLATFALVDAIGIKTLLQTGRLPSASLHALQTRIDLVAGKYPYLAFVSFADSLLVKQVWSVGHVGSSINYTYSPEAIFPAILDLHIAIKETLGVEAYTVMAQGMNAYDDQAPLHISAHQNHVSLNSLGVPFAQLLAMETAVRRAIRTGEHSSCGLYVDSLLHRSLKLDPGFRDSLPFWPYQSPMTRAAGATYLATSIQAVLENLR
jgi:hypothetical protein